MRIGIAGASMAALVVAIVACWSSHPVVVENHGNAAARDLTGAYWCTIAYTDSESTPYDPFPCTVHRVADQFVLAKLGGSLRFRGEAKPLATGFSFDGELFCVFGDCTERMHGAFRPSPNGGLIGRFPAAKVVVRMTPAPDSAFGGVAYGGDGYGGGTFGGASYGGASYGGATYGGGRNPRP